MSFGCVLDVVWMSFGCLLDVFWLSFGCLLDVFWICFGCLLDVFWMCFGCLLDVVRMSFGCLLFVFWMSFGCLLDFFWICFGCVLEQIYCKFIVIFLFPSINPAFLTFPVVVPPWWSRVEASSQLLWLPVVASRVEATSGRSAAPAGARATGATKAAISKKGKQQQKGKNGWYIQLQGWSGRSIKSWKKP